METSFCRIIRRFDPHHITLACLPLISLANDELKTFGDWRLENGDIRKSFTPTQAIKNQLSLKIKNSLSSAFILLMSSLLLSILKVKKKSVIILTFESIQLKGWLVDQDTWPQVVPNGWNRLDS